MGFRSIETSYRGWRSKCEFFLCRIVLRVGEKSWPRKEMNITHLPELSHSCRRCISFSSLDLNFRILLIPRNMRIKFHERSVERGRRSHSLRSQFIHAYNQPFRMQLLKHLQFTVQLKYFDSPMRNMNSGPEKRESSVNWNHVRCANASCSQKIEGCILLLCAKIIVRKQHLSM